MLYRQLLTELERNIDFKYRAFHKKLLKNERINVLGVRVPVLRRLAKNFNEDIKNLLSFPDEYYEVTFIKLIAVSDLEYERFIEHIDLCVSLIDNWAVCDCFKAKCIRSRRKQFLPFIEKYISTDEEFYQRFALVTLLYFYADDEYLEYLTAAINKANKSYYYVHTAVAWLVAEIVIKYFDIGVKLLQSGVLDTKTHNKAIQKANESFRLSDEQKKFLKEIKR